MTKGGLYVHIIYAKWQGIDFRKSKKIFLVAEAPVTALGTTKPSMQLVPAALYLPVKRPEREAHHTHAVLEFRNSWTCISTPQYAFMSRYVIKYRENFILTV
jgi:hypothetical protein